MPEFPSLILAQNIVQKPMKALDLFCGLGGWSDGLAMEGFDVLGVEIEPEIAKIYKHPVIISDVRDLNGKDFQGYDLIVGSPPCRDFSSFSHGVWKKKNQKKQWRIPPKPETGLELVRAFLRIVDEVQPTYWLMENVPELEKYLGTKPKYKRVKLAKNMIRSFWGNFPNFFIPMDLTKKKYRQIELELKFKEIKSILGYRRLLSSFVYARIPEPTARALGKAVRISISKETKK